jgi:serine/threonine-protein kinase
MTRTTTRDRFVGGERIGDYIVERELRSEDLGVVYLGVHVVLPRRAAVKVMHPSARSIEPQRHSAALTAGGRPPQSMAVQMLREACVLEALSHAGAPRGYECGVLADKRPWVATELVVGATLAEELAHAPIALADLVVVVRAIADVLAHAHSRGVVHARVSETIVVRTPERTFPLCLRGWGDVHALDSEQAADPTSDVHALGALAFRVLTGAPLVAGASAERACPAAPSELTRLVDEMLAPEPTARPTADAIRDRADWLAETLQLVPAAPRPRYRPLGQRMATASDATSPVSIRIRS